MTFIKEIPFVKVAEDMPHTLDIVVLQGYIRIIHIYPIPYGLSEFPPLLLIVKDAVLAFIDELFHAIVFDLLFT